MAESDSARKDRTVVVCPSERQWTSSPRRASRASGSGGRTSSGGSATSCDRNQRVRTRESEIVLEFEPILLHQQQQHDHRRFRLNAMPHPFGMWTRVLGVASTV